MDMNTRRFLISMSVLLAITTLFWGVNRSWAQSPKGNKELKYRGGKVTRAEGKAAADRARVLGLRPGVAGLTVTQTPDPGGVPHYFGPYGNWAYSPLPKGPVTAVTLTSGGSGYNNPQATISDVYGTGADVTFSATQSGGVVQPIIITNPSGVGADFSAPIVTIVDDPLLCGGVLQPVCGTGAEATASIAAVPIGGKLTGGIQKFIDPMPIPPVAQGSACSSIGYTGTNSADCYEIWLVEYRRQMHSNLPTVSGTWPNQTGGTKLRGYVEVINGVMQTPTYMGPTIVAKRDVPVRIKFVNKLPTGTGGDLFLPVDETVMGSGMGPAGPGTAGQTYTQNRATVHMHGNNTVWISDGTPHQWITPANESTPYPTGVSVQNVPDMSDPGPGAMTFYYTNVMSARLMFYHDHTFGITRLNVYAGEAAGYVVTDDVEKDMINGTNNTGINIAGGTSTPFKKVLPDIGIPLVIQDKTFVDETTIWAQDPTWNWGTGPRVQNPNYPTQGPPSIITAAVTGDLWYPHVYMTAQNPWDLTGTNAFGRWHYGPWFINQTPTCVDFLPAGCIEVGPVPNEYYQPICDTNPADPTCTAPWEPPMRPGTPNPSTPGEAYADTPIVNGTAYPYLVVEPKAYRFRILNAANDRFFNLQLYVAADKTTPTTPGTAGTVLCAPTPADPTVCTEVKMVPVGGAPNQLADTPSGIPDPATKGPNWIQIGTEGGFLPAPVVIPSQPIGYNLNPTTFNYGNVNQHSLFLGAAERADVVVDFTGQGGKTFILYNDSPAAVPAGSSTNDYYTGTSDQTGAGGAPTTQPGYGPNTRTIMQIRVLASGGTTPDVTLENLQAVFAKTASKHGVFEASQDPIIVPQAAYNSAYGVTNFPTTAAAQYVQLADGEKTFKPINKDGVLQPAVTLPLEMKAMHDEMGGVYDTQFGRMSGMLGLTLPSGTGVGAFYGYASPPTDIHLGSVDGSQIGSLADGTQIWRIFHNGVDAHPIHVHLFNAQLINRVGQDGMMLPPEPNELGWKDTFRVNPLEVTYIAMRPIIPTPAQVPFEVPDSIRLIDPTLPEGATLIPPPPSGWVGPDGVTIPEILNHYVNFGWEYAWHCHILAHEEMDMMHSLVFAVPPTAPTGLTAAVTGAAQNPSVELTWTDNSLKELRFTIQRATDADFTMGLTTVNYVNPSTVVPSNVTYLDTTVKPNVKYWYRVFAIGDIVGETQVYPGSLGFPKMSANSVSNTVGIQVGTVPDLPAAPTNLTATVQSGPRVRLIWMDNATNETGFVIERCAGSGCANFARIAVRGPRNGRGNVTYMDTTVTAGNSYSYRVAAVNGTGSSDYATLATPLSVPAVPAVPTSFTVAAVKANGYKAMLTWIYTADPPNPTNFTIQRARNATFTTGRTTSTVAGAARSLTQTVTKNTTYYYRIRANSNISGSSAWANALPFPIRTGP
jgi:FtsP/CotA-like multicopper oxidase with cupredoxin domain